jgi:hypothetical protein
MGVSQSTPQQNHQEYNQQPQESNDDSDIMTKIKSKDLFYYIVPLKNKNNKIIEGYDLMIAVNNKHEIQNTTVLSMNDYNKIVDEKFKNKFTKITKKISDKKKNVKKIR